MTTQSSILTWEIPWTEEPGRATVPGVTKESDMTEHSCMMSGRIILTIWEKQQKFPGIRPLLTF